MAEKEPDVIIDEEEDIIVDLDNDDVEKNKERVPEKDANLASDDDDDDDESDESGEGELSETDAKRIARRDERKRKREKARHEKERMQRELADLKRQNADFHRRLENVDKRTVTQDLSQIDAAMTQASQAAQMAERKLAAAVAAGNGNEVVSAQREWYNATQAQQQLTEVKRRMVAQPEPQKGVDPLLQANYQAWQARNSWYDSSTKDPDSKVAYAIDTALAEEGWNPREPGYWDELDKRLKTYLPHRYRDSNQGEEVAKPRPPTGGSPKNPTIKPNQMRLSPERVQAIKDAGAWDDPESRKKFIKRYAEYDRAHKGDK